MKRVTGIGGVFFKSKSPAELKQWYANHLDIQGEEWGKLFRWHPEGECDKLGTTTWSPFPANTDYFAPSEKPFMINYRVHDLVKLLDTLKKEGVKIVGEIQEFEYGKFAWIIDPEGNKIELWEPVDAPFVE